MGGSAIIQSPAIPIHYTPPLIPNYPKQGEKKLH